MNVELILKAAETPQYKKYAAEHETGLGDNTLNLIASYDYLHWSEKYPNSKLADYFVFCNKRLLSNESLDSQISYLSYKVNQYKIQIRELEKQNKQLSELLVEKEEKLSSINSLSWVFAISTFLLLFFLKKIIIK